MQVTGRSSIEEVLLKISYNSQKNTNGEISFSIKEEKVESCWSLSFSKNVLQHRCFYVNVVEFLRASITEHFLTTASELQKKSIQESSWIAYKNITILKSKSKLINGKD